MGSNKCSTVLTTMLYFSVWCFVCQKIPIVDGNSGQKLAYRYQQGANSNPGSDDQRPNLGNYFKVDLDTATTEHAYTITNIPVSGIPAAKIIPDCNAFIDYFANLAAELTKCAIRNARPLTFCQFCVENYTKAADLYDHIMKDNLVDRHGTKCREMILDADTVKLVFRTHSYIDDLWMKCKCDSCFDVGKGENGTIRNMTNETQHFFKLINETDECFKNYSRGYIVPIGGNSTVNETVCDQCKSKYQELNEFYRKLEKHYEGTGVCMDIVDAINFTRILWSRDFRCHRKKHDTVVVVLVSTIFCLLPIAFYVASRLHGAKLEAKILQEKRMKSSSEEDVQQQQQPELPAPTQAPSTSAAASIPRPASR